MEKGFLELRVGESKMEQIRYLICGFRGCRVDMKGDEVGYGYRVVRGGYGG